MVRPGAEWCPTTRYHGTNSSAQESTHRRPPPKEGMYRSQREPRPPPAAPASHARKVRR